MQDKNNAKKLAEAIEAERQRHAAKGSLNPDDITCSTMQGWALADPDQWAVIRDDAAFTTIRAGVVRSIQRALRFAVKEDERQFLLPGFKRLEQFVKIGDTYHAAGKLLLSDYRTLIAECEARVEHYQYPRRSTQAEKRDKELLRELRKFESVFVRHAAGDPAVTLERAQELDALSPAIEQRRQAGKARWKVKKAGT